MKYDWSKHAPQPWRSVVTPLALPILIQRAKAGDRITYGELGDEIFKRFGEKPTKRKTLYGQAVGAIGFAIEDLARASGESIPPLNAIVVNAATKLPGDGVDYFIRHFLKKGVKKNLSKQDRRDLMCYMMERVWEYPRWDWVAGKLGADSIETADRPQKGALELPPIEHLRGGESAEHKALKRWVAQNPQMFKKYGKLKPGENEYLLRSGDFLDAYFHSKAARLAVEVKTSKASEAELVRGIFQVVKYRAVLRAEQITAGQVPNGQSLLVTTQSLPKQVQQLAKRLMVEYLIVNPVAERARR